MRRRGATTAADDEGVHRLAQRIAWARHCRATTSRLNNQRNVTSGAGRVRLQVAVLGQGRSSVADDNSPERPGTNVCLLANSETRLSGIRVHNAEAVPYAISELARLDVHNPNPIADPEPQLPRGGVDHAHVVTDPIDGLARACVCPTSHDCPFVSARDLRFSSSRRRGVVPGVGRRRFEDRRVRRSSRGELLGCRLRHNL